MNTSLLDDAFAAFIRAGRRKPLVHTETLTPIALERAEIERMLPHRDPMLLVDTARGVSLTDATLHAERTIDPRDPVLAGHFPGAPVYPGALLLESMGQTCLCLHHLLEHSRTFVEPDDRPCPVRLLKVHHAVFLEECGPGAQMTLLARRLDHDGVCMTSAAQVLRDDRIAAFAILEVYLEQ